MEKIKTIGSTYMAAAGLTRELPGEEVKVCVHVHWKFIQTLDLLSLFLKRKDNKIIKRISTEEVNDKPGLWLPLQKCDMTYSHVRSMLEFAIALMGKLELINTHSFNSFKLRIGESVWDFYQQDSAKCLKLKWLQ